MRRLRLTSRPGLLLLAAAGVLAGACRGADALYRDAGLGSAGAGGQPTPLSGGGGTSATGPGGQGGAGSTGDAGSGGSTVGAGGAGSGGSMADGGATGGAGGSAACGSCAIQVQYSCRESDATEANFYLKLVNLRGNALTLSDLSVRYWYLAPAGTAQKTECDYATLGCTNLFWALKPITPARPKANAYAELSFGIGAGLLDGFQDSGEIQFRLHNDPNTARDQSNDYSFDCSMMNSYVPSMKIAAYVKGLLVWGTEP